MHFYQTSFNTIEGFKIPAPVRIQIFRDREFFGEAEPIYTIEDELAQVIIRVGIKNHGYSHALMAHEANHTAVVLMTAGRWREWASTFKKCRFPREETVSWLIEGIVAQGERLALSYDIPMHIPQGVHACET